LSNLSKKQWQVIRDRFLCNQADTPLPQLLPLANPQLSAGAHKARQEAGRAAWPQRSAAPWKADFTHSPETL